MSRDDPQMKIRMPADLKARIEDVSVANGRTMNAEIVNRLEASLDGKAVHIPDQIREELLKRATANGWPFESEFVHILVDALTEHEAVPPPRMPEDAARQFPHVISALEKELANSAAEKWILRNQSHQLGHALQAVLKANEQGLTLQAHVRRELLALAQEACQGADHDEDPLKGLERELDGAEAKANEFSRLLVDSAQQEVPQLKASENKKPSKRRAGEALKKPAAPFE